MPAAGDAKQFCNKLVVTKQIAMINVVKYIWVLAKSFNLQFAMPSNSDQQFVYFESGKTIYEPSK